MAARDTGPPSAENGCGRLLTRRSNTFHSLPIPIKTAVRKGALKQHDFSPNKKTRAYSVDAKCRPLTAPRRLKPNTGITTKTSLVNTSTRRDLSLVLGNDISFQHHCKQTKDKKKDYSSIGFHERRRTSSASFTRSRSLSSAGSTEGRRSRSGSKTTLSGAPGLVKLSGSLTMKSCSEVDHDDDEEERRQQLKEKFRRAVRLVSIFSAFCIGIRRYAEQEQSAEYDLYYLRDMLPGNEDKPTPVQEASLYFNKHLFSRDNTLHFPMWAQWTCAQAPSDRSDAEINKLVTLLRGMKSFNKFSREAQWQLCRTMSYARYEKRRVIVRQGHPGFCFYFIVSGTVSVTVTRRDFNTGIYVTTTVDVLEKNDAFGEIALMSDGACRTATIICRERVEVLVVSREAVIEHCPDLFQKEFQEKLKTLKAHDLFQQWDDKSLEQLCFESHIKELAHGKLVDPDTTSSEAIYFILRGKVDMLRRLDLSAVLASKVSISLCEAHPLPRPSSAMPRKGKSSVDFVNVGSLYKNHAWDLRTLSPSGFTEPGNILVSAGVRLLKVPKQRILQLSPHGALEQFENNFVQDHRCPSDEELYQEYLAAQTWLEYRQKVVKNVIDIKRGHSVAHSSCLSKGTSGWGAWPTAINRTWAISTPGQRVSPDSI